MGFVDDLGPYVVIGVVALAYLAGVFSVLVVDLIAHKPPRDVEGGKRTPSNKAAG